MAQRCAHRSVLWPRVSAQVPLAAVARGSPKGLDFLRWDALDELGMDWSEVLTFAVHELAGVPASWEVVHRHEHTERPLLLSFQAGGIYTASRLLDPDFLRAAAALLDVPVVLTSVPSLRQIYVTDGSPNVSAKLTHAFDLWTRKQYTAAAGVDALSYRCFYAREGRLVGLYESIGQE